MGITFINRKGYPTRVKEKFLNQEFEVVISAPLLKELSEVLRRPRIKNQYKITDEEINLFIEILAGTCRKVYLTNDVNICRDRKDNMVLETAIKGGADYLVTRDDDIKKDARLIEEMKKHGINIVSVSRFLEILSE
jgi:putative PIN family toxin of toxin-antitoxin system